MASTTRLGLHKPAGGDTVSVTTDLNNNLDAIDLNIGFRTCTSSTRPSVVWAGLCIFETNTNNTYVSNGSSPASTSWIQIPNGSAATNLQMEGSSTGSNLVELQTTADTSGYRLTLNAGGEIEWGAGGVSVPDTNLYRSASNRLKTDDRFEAVSGLTTAGTVDVTGGATTTDSVNIRVSGDTNARWVANGDGTLEWGSGSAVSDTNLYRSGASTLTTDSSLTVSGDFLVLGKGQSQYFYKTTDTSRTSSTKLDDPDLTLSLLANSTYFVEFIVMFGTNSPGLVSTLWTVPSGATGVRSVIGPGSTASQTNMDNVNGRFGAHNFTTNVVYGTRNNNLFFFSVMEFALVTTTTAGTCALKWGQDTSNATASTLAAGSFMRVTKVA